MRFEFQNEKVIEEIKRRKAKNVLIQLPEGIKRKGLEIANLLEKKTGVKVIVSGETCWGGCDIAIDEAKNLGADFIIHYGHAPFKEYDYKDIFYVECYDNFKVTPLIKRSLESLNSFKKIALISSIQHIHKLKEVKEFLEKNNKEILIPSKKGYSYYDGHVVGCEYSGLKNISCDAVLVLGNQFHSLGASLSIDKNVYLIDIYNNNVILMNSLRDKVIKQRFASIERAKKAKRFGIIQGNKPGQKFGSADILKKYLQEQDKEVLVITMSEITPDKLLSFYNIEAFIELACPRIAIEDYDKYPKPILTFKEALVLVNKLSWEDLLKQGLI